MEKILSKVKTGGAVTVAIFGFYVMFSVAQGNGCADIKDRASVKFGVENNLADAGE